MIWGWTGWFQNATQQVHRPLGPGDAAAPFEIRNLANVD
ncbi:hypothetical protein CEV33_4923 [Brucella grignonensis]|uniref:Uncharacterized protein n=1 Tax=Brucella grignonensis TaxID=94627 RepID=A0A256FS80_9HYPH|nr:hypothetical protein CEV33_4923 [Brucella grignonensis]